MIGRSRFSLFCSKETPGLLPLLSAIYTLPPFSSCEGLESKRSDCDKFPLERQSEIYPQCDFLRMLKPNNFFPPSLPSHEIRDQKMIVTLLVRKSKPSVASQFCLSNSLKTDCHLLPIGLTVERLGPRDIGKARELKYFDLKRFNLVEYTYDKHLWRLQQV
jgi:hypothetical protein